MENLEKIVEKYPCAFPRWVGPFAVFFYIYDPDYAKTFLSRTGKKRDESQDPNPPRSDMTQPTGRILKEFWSKDTGGRVERFPTNPEGDSHVPLVTCLVQTSLDHFRAAYHKPRKYHWISRAFLSSLGFVTSAWVILPTSAPFSSIKSSREMFPGQIISYRKIQMSSFCSPNFVKLMIGSASLCYYLPCVHACAKSLQSCPTLCDPMDCSLPGSSVHGILQERMLEWVAMFFSRGSSRPRDWTHVS